MCNMVQEIRAANDVSICFSVPCAEATKQADADKHIRKRRHHITEMRTVSENSTKYIIIKQRINE